MRVRGGFCSLAAQDGGGPGAGGRDTHRNTHTHTHTGTYTQMLHLPFSDLPLKKCPTHGERRTHKQNPDNPVKILLMCFLLYVFFFSLPTERGVGSVVVEFGVLGVPRFSVQASQNTCFKGFWDLGAENPGAPKTPNPTAMDPTPPSRPSEQGHSLKRKATKSSKSPHIRSITQ